MELGIYLNLVMSEFYSEKDTGPLMRTAVERIVATGPPSSISTQTLSFSSSSSASSLDQRPSGTWTPIDPN